MRNAELLKRRLMRARNSVLLNSIRSWDNLTKEQIEALHLILDRFEQMENDSRKHRFF